MSFHPPPPPGLTHSSAGFLIKTLHTGKRQAAFLTVPPRQGLTHATVSRGTAWDLSHFKSFPPFHLVASISLSPHSYTVCTCLCLLSYKGIISYPCKGLGSPDVCWCRATPAFRNGILVWFGLVWFIFNGECFNVNACVN